jgi:hypothetical protein
MELSNPIENWDCLLSCEQHPMNEQQTEMMMVLLMADETEWKAMQERGSRLEQTLQFRILSSRLQAAGLLEKVDKRVLYFVCSLIDSPGTAVMWAYTLAYMASKKEPGIPLVLDDITNTFAMGFPDNNGYQEKWDYQKGFARGLEIDNCLDNVAWWPKIKV